MKMSQFVPFVSGYKLSEVNWNILKQILTLYMKQCKVGYDRTMEDQSGE